MQFDNTRIYARSLELVEVTRQIMHGFPTGYGFLADQLRRAASSVPLNFAEGYGRNTAREQRRFFVIARGSACEVAAVLDVANAFGIVTKNEYEKAKDICDHLARMLTKFRRY